MKTENIQITGSDIDITVNGITICYDDFGKGSPVIFIHGFPFNKSLWQPQMQYLKSTHRVIAYDIRGFGKSTAGNEETSMSLFASDLVKFMDALQIEKAIVCGLSMGGYILLNAVHHYPQRFKALILSDTQCVADSYEIKKKRKENISKIKTGGLESYTEEFLKTAFYKKSLDTKKEIVEKIKNMILATPPAIITGTLHALATRWQTCSSLNEIYVPTLIICGREDKITPLVQSEFMFKNIKGSQLHIIEEAGHLSNIEQPDEFNSQLINFISGLNGNMINEDRSLPYF